MTRALQAFLRGSINRPATGRAASRRLTAAKLAQALGSPLSHPIADFWLAAELEEAR